jgi:ribosomal-protein-alanine N-acetyltransferase
MIKIQKMTNNDLEGVFIIEGLSFTTPWSFESFYNEVNVNHLAYYAVVLEAGQVVGYGGMWSVIDEAHVTNVAIHPDHRGKGYSKQLMAHMMAYAKSRNLERMTLEVRVGNTVAISLYQQMGFLEAGRRPKYYEDTGEDALILWVTL